MTRVVFSAAAQAEVREASRFYAERSPALAERFSAELDAAISRIAGSPTTWPMVSPRLRRYVLRRFPYIVLFRPDRDAVLVAAVAHQRQDPAGWRDR